MPNGIPLSVSIYSFLFLYSSDSFFGYETAFLFFSFCTILNEMCIFTYKSKGKCTFQL